MAGLLLMAFAIAVVVIWRAQARSLFWTMVSPVAALRNAFDATESAQLRAELASTTAALSDRNVLYQENLALKALYGRSVRTPSVVASVLLRPPATPYDTLTIDAGSSEGVVQGALVSAGGSTLIGTVSEVYNSNARVTLFSTPNATYSATIALAAEPGKVIPITLTGEGGGSFSAQVPAATPVAIGDAIMIPGIATGYAGTVSYIDKQDGESFQTVYMHLPVDPFELQFVLVRLPSTSH
jgi:cell shape-determining protein MreC